MRMNLHIFWAASTITSCWLVTSKKRNAFSSRARRIPVDALTCLDTCRSCQASRLEMSNRLLAALTMLSSTSWMYWDLL